MMFTVTERAAAEIKRQALKRQRPDDWVVIGIMGGGCSGFSYLFTWRPPMVAMVNQDHLFEEHGVKVFIDHKSMLYLQDTTLDYETSIRGHGFKFVNPNVKSVCGCGDSIQF